jgi:hypothetical protein
VAQATPPAMAAPPPGVASSPPQAPASRTTTASWATPDQGSGKGKRPIPVLASLPPETLSPLAGEGWAEGDADGMH